MLLSRLLFPKRSLCTLSRCPEIIPLENENEEKVLKVAIIGSPNAGKSTLINGLVGRRVCSASAKVHTTRNNIKAIGVTEKTQLIFLDTPGVVSKDEVNRHKLEDAFVSHPKRAVLEADIIALVHDVSNKWFIESLDPKAINLLQMHKNKHSILILNKIDMLKKKHKLLKVVKILTNNSLNSSGFHDKRDSNRLPILSESQPLEKLHSWSHFSEVFMVSALSNEGVDRIKEYLLHQAKPGAWMFRNDQFTDMSPEKVILETVQSRVLEYLPREVPYNISTEMEYFEVRPDGRIVSVVLLVCPTLRVQKLVCGRKGYRIKLIAMESEQFVQDAFHEEVFLKVVVTCR